VVAGGFDHFGCGNLMTLMVLEMMDLSAAGLMVPECFVLDLIGVAEEQRLA